MNRTIQILLAASMLFILSRSWCACAQTTTVSYQGRITDNGANFNGAGQFKFALVTTNGTVTTWWSNDGTSVNGSQPTAAVSVNVSNGLFTIVLGNTALANMTAIPAAIFAAEPNLHLLIWFNDGANGFAELTPPQSLTPVPQATFANSASNLLGTLPSTQLNGTVSLAQLPAAVVTNNDSSYVTLNVLAINHNLFLDGYVEDSDGRYLFYSDYANNFFAGADAGYTYISQYEEQGAQNNTAVGGGALGYNRVGCNNTAYGFQALDFLGLSTNETGGTNDIAVGYNAGSAFTGNESGNIDIGNSGTLGENNIIRIGTPSAQTATYLAGNVYASGAVFSNGVQVVSDRNAKEDFSSISPQAVLDKVAAMPVTEWHYKTDQTAKHIGPMAQDFHAAFGLDGSDDKHISVLDEGGVALAAIQGLNEKLKAQTAENAQLKEENSLLAKRLDELEAEVKTLAQKNQ